MSNHLLPRATGIDYQIQKLQTYLYERLYNTWGTSGLTDALFEMYGRVCRNEENDGFVPQWYTGGVDYALDMYHNDKVAALIWFGVNDPINVDQNRHEYNVSLYCFCNVNMLYPTATTQRLDEQIKWDVEQLISAGNVYGFKVEKIWGDVDNVLSKYSGNKKRSALKDNLQPKLCFKIDMTVAFDITTVQACVAPSAIPANFYAMTGSIAAVIKRIPDTSLTQALCNGVKIQLEYPEGTTLTIPHLVGRYIQIDVSLGTTIYRIIPNDTNYMPYDLTTGTFTYNQQFQEGDVFILMCNENN